MVRSRSKSIAPTLLAVLSLECSDSSKTFSRLVKMYESSPHGRGLLTRLAVRNELLKCKAGAKSTLDSACPSPALKTPTCTSYTTIEQLVWLRTQES